MKDEMLQPYELLIPQRAVSRPRSLRDMVAVGFRRRRLILISFLGLLLGTVLVLIIVPPWYRARMEVLIKNDRVDPAVSAQPLALPPSARDAITEQQVNSEVELLQSDDLLRKVVQETGLDKRPSLTAWLFRYTPEERTAKAVRKLNRGLDVQPVRKSNMIEVTYSSSDRELAARVLNALGNAYVQKHLEVHHTPGQSSFFEQQAERYRKEMLAAEAKLAASGNVAPALLRDQTVQKRAEFTATLAQTRAGIRETQNRIKELSRLKASVPERLTTASRKADNPQLLQDLKGTLLKLELDRSQLLAKFQPTYRPVQEIEKQIAETKASIQHEESAPLRDVTTDQNPTHAWVDGELAKAKAELVGLQARASATEGILRNYDENAKELEQKTIAQQDLERAAKQAQDNYLLYARKSEEARITDALDRNRFLNVAIAQEALVPALPRFSRLEMLVMGLLLAVFLTAGLVFLAEYFNSTYRTPAEVSGLLHVPVLAAIPLPEAERERWLPAGSRS